MENEPHFFGQIGKIDKSLLVVNVSKEKFFPGSQNKERDLWIGNLFQRKDTFFFEALHTKSACNRNHCRVVLNS